jgi:UDP-glucuronate 4-epimerase
LICHLASMAGVRNSILEPSLYFDVNVQGFVNILEQAMLLDNIRIVYASSSSVYGLNKKLPFSEYDKIETCNSPYACSKMSMELVANCYSQLVPGLTAIGLRFFTVYGPRGRPDMAPYKFLRGIAEGTEIKRYGDGLSSRDYTYIDDIVDGVMAALFTPNLSSTVYNLGNNKPIILNDFIKLCEQVTGYQAHIVDYAEQLGDVPHTCADITKAEVTLRDGLSYTYNWMLKSALIRRDDVDETREVDSLL